MSWKVMFKEQAMAKVLPKLRVRVGMVKGTCMASSRSCLASMPVPVVHWYTKLGVSLVQQS